MRMSQNQLLLQHHAWKMSRSSVKSERSTAQLCNFTIRIVGNCPWIAGDVREISHVWALCRESHKFHESAMWLKQEVGKAQRRKANNNTTTETKTKSTRPPKWAVHRSLASFFFLPIVRFISVKLNIFFHPTFLLSLLLARSCVDFAAAPEHGQNERDKVSLLHDIRLIFIDDSIITFQSASFITSVTIGCVFFGQNSIRSLSSPCRRHRYTHITSCQSSNCRLFSPSSSSAAAALHAIQLSLSAHKRWVRESRIERNFLIFRCPAVKSSIKLSYHPISTFPLLSPLLSLPAGLVFHS